MPSSEQKSLTLHPDQERAFLSDYRITAMVSGIQGGKTTNGALWARSRLGDLSDPNDTAIIASPDYKIFSQSTFPKFQEYFAGYGKLDKKEMAFRVNGGGTIYLRSMHDPDSCEGITNVRWIWADEAGKMKKLAWTNLSGRSAFREAPIFLTTTPYALNWLYKDLYKPYKQGKLKDVLFVQFRSVDNPYFPKAEYERQKGMLDARDFARKYEGKFEKMAGLVFMDFDESLNMVDPFPVNKRDYFIGAGVDWGFTNAFAIVPRAIHRKEPGRDYQLGEFYQSYMTPSQKVTVAKQYQEKFGIEIFYCDNEEPAMIKEFNNAGLHAVAAPKYPGSLVDNIARHNALIKTRDYKMFRGRCPNTEEEYETYHYPEDDGKEKNPDENPVDSNNHAMTANMYFTQCTEHIREASRQALAFKPGKSRLERLLAGEFSQTGNKADDWYENGNTASYE